MQGFVKIMKALSDPNRIKILKMLQRHKMCVCEIQSGLQISQPSVSKHLKVLEKAGLVTSKKSGLWVNYQLNDGNKHPYVATVMKSFRGWLEDEAQLVEILKKLPGIRRKSTARARNSIPKPN